jgi:hypothetical protein
VYDSVPADEAGLPEWDSYSFTNGYYEYESNRKSVEWRSGLLRASNSGNVQL